MAIHTESESTMQKGFVKKMDVSGINMMFDTLQKYQYSYPVKSTVRELLSNGIDSIVEKQTAIKILSGAAQVSDFFVDKDGDLYKDSKFDPTYYNLKWLSGNDKVELKYHVGSNTKKDYVTITDHGVGLGGKRLEKYFSLGYSTKRLSKLPLGKFGLGAKSPLSVGVDMYTIESCYNGQLFRFNIYSHKVDSIIPALNFQTGKENDFILFDEGGEQEYKVYYLPTEELNRMTITIDAKKHHKDQYIDAVKSQMLYFDHIRLVLDTDSKEEEIPYKAKVLYEDDFIILSDNQYFTQPHLLLNGVNYGFIDWNELELEVKRGNIGIKVQPEEIDVNPSRESVLWTEQTKTMVTQRFNNVVDIATKMIQEELREKDIVKWMRTCYQVAGHYSNRNDILGRLANIVDLSTINPKFMLEPKIAFKGAEPFTGMLMKFVLFGHRTNRETGEVRKVINRKIVDSLFDYFSKPIILINDGERANNRKDKYLLHLHPEGYISIHEPILTEEKLMETKDEELIEWAAKKGKKAMSMVRQDIWDFLKASSEVLFYENVEVPEGFTGNDDEEVIQEAQAEVIKEVKEAAVTAAERRKQTGKTILHTLTAAGKSNTRTLVNGSYEQSAGFFSFTKLEYPIAKINDWKEEEIYYCNDKDSELMHLVALITLPRQRDEEGRYDPQYTGFHFDRYYSEQKDWENSKYYRTRGQEEIKIAGIESFPAYSMLHFFDCKVRLVKIAQSNNYLYRDFQPVTNFFIQVKNKTITMSNTLIKWNTARIIRDRLVDCSFLHNFSAFNPKYAEMYDKLCTYVDANYRKVEPHDKVTGLTGTTYHDMISHLDNVHKFQQFVKENNDADTIASLARELFGNKEIKDGMAVDPEIVEMMNELSEFSVACGDMLNHVGLLTGTHFKPTAFVSRGDRATVFISGDVELDIRKYLEYRGVLNFEEEEDGDVAAEDPLNFTVEHTNETLI